MLQFVIFNVGMASVSYALGYYDGSKQVTQPIKLEPVDDRWTVKVSEK